jgi:hypothetical protein
MSRFGDMGDTAAQTLSYSAVTAGLDDGRVDGPAGGGAAGAGAITGGGGAGTGTKFGPLFSHSRFTVDKIPVIRCWMSSNCASVISSAPLDTAQNVFTFRSNR